MPHDKVMRSIELFATEVAPAVREEIASKAFDPSVRIVRQSPRSIPSSVCGDSPPNCASAVFPGEGGEVQ